MPWLKYPEKTRQEELPCPQRHVKAAVCFQVKSWIKVLKSIIVFVSDGEEGLFSRPGSGPIILSPEGRGRKNRIGTENNTSSLSPETTAGGTGSNCRILPRIDSASKFSIGDELRKGSAQSKASCDSGISLGESSISLWHWGKKVDVAFFSRQFEGTFVLQQEPPPFIHSFAFHRQRQLFRRLQLQQEFFAQSCAKTCQRGHSLTAQWNRYKNILFWVRLGFDKFTNIGLFAGIVPLRTNRCGSSLAFNIELDKKSEDASMEDEAKLAEDSSNGRSLPPLPPNRIQRLQTLPPIQPSLEQLEAKQKKAEQRRKVLVLFMKIQVYFQ